MDQEESIAVATPPEDAYPPSDYTISAPEDPVFFASQQVEPVTPAPEDPSVVPTIFTSDIVPVPLSEVEGLNDTFAATDPNGNELPPNLTFNSIFPSIGLPFEGGTLCTITGTNLNLVSEIRIVGTVVPFAYINANTLQFVTPVSPDNSAGTKNVELYDAFAVLQATAPITYDPQVAAFGLVSVVPNTGSILGNEVVILNGSAFFFIASVTIGGEPVFDFQIINSTSMRIVTPPGLIGAPVDVRVTSYDGTVVQLTGAFTYTYPPPFLLGLDKNSGDVAGGTDVTISGAFLQGATSVLVDGVPTTFNVINAGAIVFQTAASVFTGIPLDVTVVTPNGSDTLFGAFTYSTTAPVPRITSVSPNKGVIGTFVSVTITGSGFTGTVQVELDGVPASSYSVVSDTKITCTAPFGSYNGGNAVPVKVTTMDGSFTKLGAFTYVYDVPTVTSTTLTTDLVEGGTNGTLFGTNFYEVTAVTIAGVPVRSYTVVSPTQIDYVTGTSPNDTNPPGDIKVITLFGVGTLSGVFTYTYPIVSLTNSSLNAGFASGGNTIVLTGTGFTLVTQVLIAGVAAASFTVDSLTQITCVTAANANPTNVPGDIQVNTVFSQAVLPNAFTYFSTMELYTCSISNGVTSGGEAGTLTGANFANIQNIFLAGHAVASFTVVNSNTITFLTGVANTYGVLGDVTILTTFGENVVLPNAFIYYPALGASGVDINKGLTTGGETRTLTGTGFYSVTSVTVCGVAVTSFTVVTPTTLTFVTAPNATLGTGDIFVGTSYTSFNFPNAFTYYPAMQVSSIDVSSGPATGGTTVVITGSGFFQVNSVTFNGAAVTSFVVNSLTQITCVTASKSLLDGETGDVVVTSPYTNDTLASVWTYWPIMSVVSLDVTNGPTTGGTTVVVTGAGFYAVTSVTFNNIAVASYTVDSPTQITVSTGIGALNGPGSVVVSSIYTSATKTNAWTYWQPMAVSTLSVTDGSTVGGTTVVVTGAGFYSVNGVTFNGVAVTSYTVNSLTQITVTTAAKVSNGDVGNVVVTSNFTSATKTNAWTYWPPMSVSSLSVSNGSTVGGTTVVITGAGFYSVNGVTFNNIAVASYTVNSNTQITIVTDAGSTNGTGDVVVTSPYTSATGTNLWTYWQPVVVSSLDVTNGPRAGGTTVVVTGSGFYSVSGVTFNGVAVSSYTVDSLTQITVVTGPKVSSNGDLGNVVVTTTYSAGTKSNAWTYWPPMSVTSLDVSNGPKAGGTTVVITGAGFYSVNSVTFNGVAVTSYTVDSVTQITVVTGPKPSSTGDLGNVVVTSNYTSATGTNLWTYYAPVVVTSLDVTNGPRAGGTTVIVTGSGFYSVSGVTFNGVAVSSYTVDSLTQITVVTGAKPSSNGDLGNVVVTTNYTSGTKSNAWTYYPPMSVTSLDVSNGPKAGGTTVVITGAGFYSVNTITFNGVAVTSYTVDSVTQITVVTGPKLSSTGDVGNVVVTSNYTSATGTNLWTYYAPVVVTSLDVTNGPIAGGTTVVVTGSGFYSVSGVTFNGVAVASYTVDSLTQITVVTDAKVTNGDLGNVVVTTNYTSGTKSNAWTYYPPMSVTSLDVSNGPKAGGTTVVITGAGFYSVNSVTFNGTNVTSYTVDSVTQITVVTGPKPSSTGDLGNVVVTSAFTSATGTNLWTYYAPVVVSSLDVTNGPRAGGTAVVITGSGFYSVSGVTFNGVAVASYTVDSVTQITVSTGAKPSSNGDVGNVVVTTNYTSGTKSNAWTYYPPVVVTSLDVSNGPKAGGTTVVITGSGFYGTITGVTFNGTAVSSFTKDSATQITVVTGAKSSSTGDLGDVVVTTSFTSGTGANLWTYYAPVVVTSLDVTNGPRAGGTTVVVTGSGFYSVSGITFNGVAVTSYTVDSVTQITVVTGPKVSSNGDVGNVVVTTNYSTGTKSNAWTYYPPMSVSSLDVSNGPKAGGTTVVITGAGFYSVTGITFNGTAVASYTVDSVTQITVVTGAKSSSTGDLGNVVVSSSFTSATGTNLWTYYAPVVVTSLDVTNGPRAGGTTVVVTGSGFYSVSGVTFNGVAVTSYTVDSLTQITVVTGPKVSSNGDVGNVVVTTNYTSGTKSNAWTYYPPMSVTSLDVSNGSRAGGTTVVITGTGFYSVSSVTFNGDAVSSYTVDSVTQITVVTGTGSANGTGNVVVTSTFTSATGTNLWTYWPVMSVTSLDVTQGSFVGGTTVNLTGTGFWNVSGVTIKGVPVRSYTVNSETSATIVTDSNMADLLATWETASMQNAFTSYFWGPLEYSSASGEVIFPTSNSTATVTTSRITSMDTTRTAHHTTENNRWGHVVYVPQLSKYIAVAYQASTSNFVATSSDGITWTPKAGQSGSWNKVVYAPALSMLAAVGGGGVMTSTDGGNTWTLQTLPVLASASWQSIAWSPTLGKFLIVGHNGNFSSSGVGYAATSTDGSTWTDLNWDAIVPKITGRGSQTFTVDWSEDLQLWCVGGNVSSYASANGTTWTRGDLTVGTDKSTNYIKYVPDLKRFVCTQTANVVATDKMRYSTDGVNWTSVNITADRVIGWTYMPNRKTIVVKNDQGLTYRVAQPAVVTGNVVVTSNYTSATKTNGFSYVPEVFIEAAETAYGSTSGGSTFKVFGGGFTGVTSVTIGGTAATSYTVDSKKQITVTAPAGTLGAKDVVVTTSFGSATLTNGFRYISVPTPLQYTLDNVTSTAVSYAISNRRVRVGYTGPIFRVRKSTTNKWTHVYDQLITDSGETLTAWLGGASAFVVTWYDQSTNANHAYRYENPSQPSLNASTAVVDFNASKTLNNTLQSIPTGTTSYTMVLRHGTTVATTSGDYMSIGAQSATPTYASILRRASASQYANLWYNGGATFTFNGYANGNSVSVVYDQTNRKGYVNGVLKGTLASTGFVVGTGAAWNWIGGTANYSNAEFYSLYATSDALSDTDRLWLEADGIDLTIVNTSVSNGTTSGGTTVVITGTGFYGIDTVSFGGVNAASFTIDSPTQITAVTASTTAVGAVGDIVVSSAIDSATSTNGWTYWPPMSFTSIDVATGVTSGGTTVVITGAGFYAVTGITFGGTAVASYTVDSATQITVSTGVSSVTSPTLGNVVVTSSYTSATGTNVWTYYPPIVVSSLDVSYGKVSGGTTVNITGSGFHNVNSVTFKGIEVLSKTVNSPTSITVTVKGDVAQLVGRNAYLGTGPPTTNFIGASTFHCWAGGSIQKWIVPGTYVYTSNDAVTFTVADVPTPGSYRYAMYVPSLAKAYVIGNGNFANRFLESSDGITWTSPGVLPLNRSWNWAAYSPTLDVFVVVDRAGTAVASPFAVSTDRGATWTTYGTGTSRAFSTVVWCTAIGKFVASGFSSVSTGIIAHSADGITWTEVDLATLFPSANVSLGQTNGVSEDLGVVVFSSGANAFTWDGTTWQTNTTGSQINNPVWVSSVYAFVGLKNSTTYAYSADGLTWTDVTVSATGVTVYGSFAYSPEQDVFIATGTGTSYNFTNPTISTNASVVVTSTYTSGTKTNAWAFVPTMAISDVDIGYGPTTGSTTVKIYGRGFRNINPGAVSFKGVAATSFTVDSVGCLITAVTAAGTAGTGNIVCANSFRSATYTNGWSYKNVSVSSYDYDALTSAAKASLSVVLQMRPVLSSYTGPLFRVWRVSDGAVTDVYASSGSSSDWFTKNGVALSTFKGTSTVRVVRWFDQSGNTSGTDGAIPKPPNSGLVMAYAYQPRYMPLLDLTNNCLDFSGGSYFMRLQDSTLPAVTSPSTITVRHGTVGNSTNGEFWNVGSNSNTPPGSGNYLRRQGSNYINNWPGVGALTLTGAYANNQVVTITNDLTTRTGYVQGASVASLAGTLAGDVLTPTIGGRGDGTVDSLAQWFLFAYASTVFGASDQAILGDTSLYAVPSITSTDVSSGTIAGGTTVVITGTGFTAATGVSFNGTAAASFTVNSATQITAVTAAGSAGRGDIVVTKTSGTSTFTNGWIYFQTNYTRSFAVTDISTTTGLNKTVNSWLTTVTYSSALGLFIVADSNAGGITQPYVTSPDGTTWTRQTAPVVSGNDTITDIGASPTAVVSCGVFPAIRRSTNGTTWTNVTASNTLTFRIAYSPTLSRWVIGRGNNNGLYYSNDDGATWSAATGAAVYVANVLWNSGSSEFYVFIRNGGSVYRSSNGTSYTLAASSLASDNYHAAAYSSDRGEMMTVGNNSSNVYSSTDGTTWTLKTTLSGVIVVGLTWSSELYLYVACTNKGLYTSIDGTVWVAMNPLTWSGTFDYSWGRWVYNPTVRKGVAAYVNTVFRTEDTVRASLTFAASQNVQVTNDADLRPGTGDFTVEWFQFQTTPTAGTTPYAFSIANDLAVSVNATSGVMSVYVGGSAVITYTLTNVYERWCHFAITRTGTTLGLFKDGNRLTTVTNSTNIANTTDVLRIANSSTTSANNQFLGRITNFHFVKGTAVYTTATYTVPTREIFAVANTKLLLTTPSGNLVGNYAPVTKTVTNNSATSSTSNPFYL